MDGVRLSEETHLEDRPAEQELILSLRLFYLHDLMIGTDPHAVAVTRMSGKCEETCSCIQNHNVAIVSVINPNSRLVSMSVNYVHYSASDASLICNSAVVTYSIWEHTSSGEASGCIGLALSQNKIIAFDH